MNKEILQNLTVLYVEDEESLRDSVSSILMKIVKELILAKNGLEGFNTFKEYYTNENLNNFDIIITDINMPKLNGLDMIKKIHGIDSTIPSVITTAHSDSDFLKESIDLGVNGYCVKPIDFSKLLNSIETAVESRILRRKLEIQNKTLEQQVKERTLQLEETIKKLKQNSEELIYQATHDNLTKLYNRQHFNSELEKEIQRYKRHNHQLSIIMFDIDHFKCINDTYGHDIGDEVLIALSSLSLHHIRSIDTLARWGGEEFLILLPETTCENTEKIAEKIRIDIENTKLINNNDYQITVSFGVTQINESDNKTSFLKRVDDALYKAKNKGRNQVISI